MSEKQPTDPLLAADHAAGTDGGPNLRTLAETRKEPTPVPTEKVTSEVKANRRAKRAEDNRSMNVIIDRFFKLNTWAKQSVVEELTEMLKGG